MLELKLLIMLILANGSPILAQKLFGERWQGALDGGRCLKDGRRLFGSTKTWRGVISACVVCALAAWLMQLPLATGILIALSAMAGDLISSFTKRRLGKASSSMALGLDQIPESLLPLLLLKLFSVQLLPDTLPGDLSWVTVIQIVVIFFVVELLLSKILYHLHIRNQPY